MVQISSPLYLRTLLSALVLMGSSLSVAAPDQSLPRKELGEVSTEMPVELKDVGISEKTRG